MSYRAIVVDKPDPEAKPAASLQDREDFHMDAVGFGDGFIEVDVDFSGINFKDAIALTGGPGILKSYPMIPGIDVVGRVRSVAGTNWAVGDTVILNGAGIGERFNGGLSERAMVPSASLVRLPQAFSAAQAAAIGTAGFTAALSVLALERFGVESDNGEVLVTGAAGGVGGIAIALLAAAGFTVTASTRRGEQEADYLKQLGATTILDADELSNEPGKALQSQRWAGVVDCVGSTTLVNALAQTQYGGVVAASGLAQGADLKSTVMPFILRSVTLTGINSVEAPLPLREQAWARLAQHLSPTTIELITERTVGLSDAPAVAADLLAGKVRGRVVVDVRA